MTPRKGAPVLSAAEFIHLFETVGPAEISRRTGQSERNIYARRISLEKKLRRTIKAPNHHVNTTNRGSDFPGRLRINVDDGIVLIAGDCHYWGGSTSTAHRALLKFIKKFKPAALILNGDVIDGAAISRHPPIGWGYVPSVEVEIEAAQTNLFELVKAYKTKRFWCLGNHDARFETKLRTVAPEYAKVHGTSLQDHFPGWEPCWSVEINDNVMVKHRSKGGAHATHNNTVSGGRSIFTNHLHCAKVTPYTDYNGTRYGVDTGMIADPWHPAFAYMEDNARNWRSGFSMATFRDGQLLYPELVLVWDADHVEFRGEIILV